MAFEIKNTQETNFEIFAQPDARDFDILARRYGLDNGVISGLAVSVQSPASLSYDVAAGTARINGTLVSYAGGTAAVTSSAANATNPRIDLITIDASAVIAKVTGTAGAVPLIPALPANKVALAIAWIPALATDVDGISTVNGHGKLLDKRLFVIATPITSGANLTNSVTSGGSSDVIADFSDLTTYSNSAAAIRNDIYQLARKVKQINDGLRAAGLAT